MSNFSNFLSKATQFRVHTGNISAWGELKLRTFNNPSDELLECLKLQLRKWRTNEQDWMKNKGVDDDKVDNFDLCKGPYCMPCQAISQYPRDELRITIKCFLSKPDPQAVRECLLVLNKELQIDFAEQLIVALPAADPDAIAPPSDSSQLLTMWPHLEPLVDEGHVAALGVADLMVDDLRTVWERAPKLKPLVNHYNIAACCSVPPELAEYAREHDIVLLTHNDPHPFLSVEQVQDMFINCLDVPPAIASQWEAAWAGRYTVMINSRSVIAGKGFLVQFQKKAN